MTCKVAGLNLSTRKGVPKSPVDSVRLITDHGIEGDAHAGSDRQVSLLAAEAIQRMRDQAKGLDIPYGAFAENIVLDGVDLRLWSVGTRLTIGPLVLEITQIGKVCHTKCAIYYQAGDCVMPREGLFAVVRTGGPVRVDDSIEVVSLGDGTCDRTPEEAVREFAEERAKEAALLAGAEVR